MHLDARDADPTSLLLETEHFVRNGQNKNAAPWRDAEGKLTEDAKILIHNARCHVLWNRWFGKQNVLHYVKWKTVVIDVKHLMCPDGCCRRNLLDGCLYESIIRPYTLQDNKLSVTQAFKIGKFKVVGLLDVEEENILNKVISDLDSNDRNDQRLKASFMSYVTLGY